MITRNAAALLFSCIALAGCTFDGTGFGEQPEATQAGTSTTGEPTSTTTQDVTSEPTSTTGPVDKCGDYQTDPGEDCDQGPGGNGVCTPACKFNICGDGYVGAGESCEGDAEGCVNCKLASCGNGSVDTGEDCDDGNAEETDACLTTCKNAGCGDSFVQAGVEACDDGNNLDTDACVAGCVMATCGDGHVWQDVEACDDGNQNDNDDCPNSCGPPGCGDGTVSPGEECDDGNQTNDDGCSNACKNPACGDAIVQMGEECDLGQTQNADNAACTSECKNNVCGDGKHLMGIEQCDDGNTVDDDECTNVCGLPACGDMIVNGDDECDDGNKDETDGCLNDCKQNVCGDGKLHMGVEQCDDGNADPFDACRETCQNNICGDGYLNPEDEACDHGPLNDNDANKGTCKNNCTRSGFLVFVTSKLYQTGNDSFDSVEDADARCAELAAADNGALKIKGGTWKAWLGDGAHNPSVELFDSQIPYYTLHNGATDKIANSREDLIDGDIITGIDITDTNQELAGMGCDGQIVVWTGINDDNSFANDCMDWSSNQMANNARAGSAKRDDVGWTDACDVTCEKSARFYCFEQPQP
ncbi:DUF4215 domain-containing protein [Nannocystis sp. SCPEA4]|uniref:DUF4215 domain-containing protein n=1 Tax=Nannocystis sp. SCPEA4 TaxID=2996787 RepID=UPI00226E356B|nr:DUF4215 domain-containing protein [Nannocystis sp. SCPEA4]MCY1056427.1 DUF4215 domain-containing protein [Nannocystis sp. SCPEA4]